MRVRLRYFSAVRRAAGEVSEETIELPEGAALADAVEAARQRHPALTPLLPSLLVTRNREWSARTALLADGDEVGLMPPVSGG